MIGMAIDALLQGRKVLHISTKETVERLREFYDLIFGNLAEHLSLINPSQHHLDMERNRHILVYNRKFFTLEKLEQSVGFLADAADFEPSLVIMDGTPRFEKTQEWEMEGVHRLAQDWNAEIWITSNTHREGQKFNQKGVPEAVARFEKWLDVILLLEPRGEQIRVRLLQERDRPEPADLHLELDPKTFLLRWR
jgi:hypothetical protein